MDYLTSFLIMLSPVIELRGGIPMAIIKDIHPVLIFLLSITAASTIFIVNRILLDTLYANWLIKSSFFARVTGNSRGFWERKLSRYGLLGLTIFVSIPFPMTGIWSGTLISWVFGIEYKKAFVSILIGASITTWIIMALTYGIKSLFG